MSTQLALSDAAVAQLDEAPGALDAQADGVLDTVSSSAPRRRAWSVARRARSEPLRPAGKPR